MKLSPVLLLPTLALAMVAPAVAQPPSTKTTPKPPHVAVAKENFLTRPAADDFAQAFPARAREEQVSGYAAIVCQLSAEGRMASCNVRVEIPMGYGFGQAALSLAHKYQLRTTAMQDGRLGGIQDFIVLPFSFDASSEADVVEDDDIPADPPPMPIAGPASLRPGGPVPAPPQIIPRPAKLVKPQWVRIPSAADFSRGYPREAERANISGDVTIRCDVGAQGRLVACAAINETPTGYGFAAAALALTDLFQMDDRNSDGLPVEGATVTIPLRFRMQK